MRAKSLVVLFGTLAASCGDTAAQTVTCVDKNYADEVYSRVQVKREGNIRTLTEWWINAGKEGDPSIRDVPPEAVLRYEAPGFLENEKDHDWEQMSIDKSGNPWVYIVDYDTPWIIYGGYQPGDRLITFEGDDCTVSKK